MTSCADCPKQHRCTQLCDEMQRIVGAEELEPEPAIGLNGKHWGDISDDDDMRPALQNQNRNLLDSARSLLTEKQFYVLEHVVLFGETQAQIAEDMGIDQSAVSRYLSNAKKKLRKILPNIS